jgi:hypothetical protein
MDDNHGKPGERKQRADAACAADGHQSGKDGVI